MDDLFAHFRMTSHILDDLILDDPDDLDENSGCPGLQKIEQILSRKLVL